MKLQLDVWQRQTTRCTGCGGKRVVYTGEAVADGSAHAVFWAYLYDHPGNPEVFIDAAFGTWGVDSDTRDHETFGSRTGKLEDHPHIASSLVTGAKNAPEDPQFGVKLTREQALVHPLLETFWAVNDAILELDEIQGLLAGRPPRRRWPWSRGR